MRNKEEKKRKKWGSSGEEYKEGEREREREKIMSECRRNLRVFFSVFSVFSIKKVFDPEGEKKKNEGEKTGKGRSEYHAGKPRKKKV